MKTQATRLSKGFTLVEVLIAMGAMMVGMVALWGLHMASLRVDARSNHETKAILWAGKLVEQLRAVSVTNFADPFLVNGSDIPEAPYTRTWTITRVNNWRKTLTVTVSWPEVIRTGSGTSNRTTLTRTVQVTTILVNLQSDL